MKIYTACKKETNKTYTEIAKKFGIAKSTVSKIANLKHWTTKDLKEEQLKLNFS